MLLLVHLSLAICYLSKPHIALTTLLRQPLGEDIVLLTVLLAARKGSNPRVAKKLLQNFIAKGEASEET